MSKKPLTITMSVELSNGEFSSRLTFPLPATKEQMDKATERWLLLQQHALELGLTSLDATLEKD